MSSSSLSPRAVAVLEAWRVVGLEACDPSPAVCADLEHAAQARSLESWRATFRAIAGSDFLSGRDGQRRLGGVALYEALTRWQEFAPGGRQVPREALWRRPVPAQAAMAGAAADHGGDVWQRVLARVEGKFTRYTFLQWFRGTTLQRDAGERIEVRVADDTVGAWILRHYAEQVQAALAEIGRAGAELVFVPDAPEAVAACS